MDMEEKLEELAELVGLDWDALGVDGIEPEEKAAALLLLTIHKGFNSDAWGNKLKRYWGAFQEKIELSLGAADLPEFCSLLAREMKASIGRNERQRAVAVRLAYSADAEAIFEKIRTSHEMLITLARVMQASIKAQYDIEDQDEEVIVQ